MFNTFFTRCFNDEVEPLQLINDNPIAGPCDSSITCTVDEVYQLLSSIDCSKATGPDSISGRMLKATAPSIPSSLCQIFNLSLTTSAIPVEWKTSNIVPVHKSGPHDLAANY